MSNDKNTEKRCNEIRDLSILLQYLVTVTLAAKPESACEGQLD